MVDHPKSANVERRRKIVRGAALLQFALALPCAFYALLFLLLPPHGQDELGLSRSIEPALAASATTATVLLTYGGALAWRATQRWWVPGLLALLGTPVLLVVLFMAGLYTSGA
jgi:hypothetical protein